MRTVFWSENLEAEINFGDLDLGDIITYKSILKPWVEIWTLDLSGSGCEKAAGCCEYGDEPESFRGGGKSLAWLKNSLLYAVQ
jgi:hypothetical protein